VPQQVIRERVREETIAGVVRAIADNFSLHKILLFGSYAYGNPTADSDLDLLLVMDTDLPKHKRATRFGFYSAPRRARSIYWFTRRRRLLTGTARSTTSSRRLCGGAKSSMSAPHIELAQRWIRKADHDLVTARQTVSLPEGPTDMVAFHT
jgi:hypothetical protein